MNETKISDLMIKYIQSNPVELHKLEGQMTEDKAADRFVRENPFAFLLSVVYSEAMRGHKVWEVPYLLKGRLGHLDPKKISTMNMADMLNIFSTKPCLHHYPKKMAFRTIRVSELVVSKYSGNARNIWNDNPTSFELQRRFEEFSGIGQKKASMAVNILARDFGVSIREEQGIDISFDRHIRRVFLRTGLVKSDDMNEVIACARRLNPDYPGILDLPTWLIGRTWCKNEVPKCVNCPLSLCCLKLTSIKIEA